MPSPRGPPPGGGPPTPHPEDLPMRLLFIDNDGGGFSDGIDAAEGTTVAQLFAEPK